jgi:hypothetical protein
MGIERYVSDIRIINKDQEVVFNYLSDFQNLGKYINEGLLDRITQLAPQIKITGFESDRDSCRFSVSGFGSSEIRITEREPFNTIKIVSSGSLPVGITLWIQLKQKEVEKTNIRLTLDADLNLILKTMIGSRLNEGVNGLCLMLANLPYN